MTDPAGIIGPLASLIAALGALPFALGQNRRISRLHHSISDIVKNIDEIKQASPKNQDILLERFEEMLESQVTQLNRLTKEAGQKKERNWPSLFMGLFCAALFTIPMWFIWHPSNWALWTLFVALGIISALFVIAGIGAWRTPLPKKPERAAS